MSNDHVSQPMAARIAPLWKGETEKAHFLKLNGLWECAPKHDAHFFATEWLPAPSIGELLSTFGNCITIAKTLVGYLVEHHNPEIQAIDHNLADALALVWLEAQGKEGK